MREPYGIFKKKRGSSSNNLKKEKGGFIYKAFFMKRTEVKITPGKFEWKKKKGLKIV